MRLYADSSARRAGQLTGDLLLVLWVLLWAWLGLATYDTVVVLADVGAKVESGASGLAGNLGEAGRKAASVPLVGDELRVPLERSAGAASSIAEAGRDQQQAVHRLAATLGAATALLPTVPAMLAWLPRSVAFVRHASAARRSLSAPDGLDLLALRALTRQPVRRLARVADAPLDAWRRGDADVVRRLAALELDDLGIPLPPRVSEGTRRPAAPTR